MAEASPFTLDSVLRHGGKQPLPYQGGYGTTTPAKTKSPLVVDRRLHIGNLLHHRVVQCQVISLMHDAFVAAEKTIPNRAPNRFFDTSDVVLMAQLLYNTTEVDKDVVEKMYPDLVAELAEYDDTGMEDDKEEEAHLMARVGLATCAHLDATDLADALIGGTSDDDEEEEEQPVAVKQVRAVKRKKGAPPSVKSSMSLGELLGHPILMHDNKEVQIATKLNYNAPHMHYASIRAQCSWANTVNTNHFVRTWYVIVFLYVSEGLRARVRAATEPGYARAYFDGCRGIEPFVVRMGYYLFGELKHDRRKKLRQLLRVAKPSPMIVLEEMMLYKLLMDHPDCHDLGKGVGGGAGVPC
jgi:hypothetical protein